MKPSSKKARSSKKVRVATTFTGAAACAFAFAPAAAAGTTQPVAAAPGHEAGARPDGLEYACPGGTEHWLHLARVQGGDMCVGDVGKYPVSFPQSISRFCGGNNSGQFSGHPVNGGPKKIVHFGHGNYYATIRPVALIISHVDINKWGGYDHCGSPPR
jgi:hypothetical protein